MKSQCDIHRRNMEKQYMKTQGIKIHTFQIGVRMHVKIYETQDPNQVDKLGRGNDSVIARRR